VQLDYGASLRAISQTNPFIYALAIAAFYLSFVVRTVRWELLLRNTGESEHFGELFHIVILAWFANCVLPAKMGDFYRAYLLRQQTDVSGSKGLGTIFSERALDFLVLMSLLVVSGLISFHAVVPQKFLPAFIVGILICAGLIAGLIVIRYSEGRLSRFIPHRLQERAAHFKHGLLSAFAGRIPLLVSLTVIVWMAESARLFLVVQALPLHVSLSIAQIVFIALVASLLTTIPALTGGLVLVEVGIIPVVAFFCLLALGSPWLVEMFRIERPEAVITRAAQASVRKSVQDPVFDASVNVLGTVALLRASVRHQVRRFLFASTGGAIYGDTDQTPTSEDAPALPVSPYGAAKLASEVYLRTFHALHGLSFAALRYANVYGPRQDPHGEAGVVAIFSQRLIRGEKARINGDGKQTRDFVYVGDVADANARALTSDQVGAFN